MVVDSQHFKRSLSGGESIGPKGRVCLASTGCAFYFRRMEQAVRYEEFVGIVVFTYNGLTMWIPWSAETISFIVAFRSMQSIFRESRSCTLLYIYGSSDIASLTLKVSCSVSTPNAHISRFLRPRCFVE